MDGRDRWAEWVLGGRDGGDRAVLEQRMPMLREMRDRVLANASVRHGDVLLDVGTGNGLIGFGALDLVGSTGRVVFSDVSADLLAECRRIAEETGTAERCRFVRAAVDELSPIEDRSVDVVTLRSVLIYVRRKQNAFAELFRVLRPGGRLSLFEPINRFCGREPDNLLFGVDVGPVADLAARVKRDYERAQPPGDNPMTDFDERDLLRFAERVGFTEIRMDYHVDAGVPQPLPSTDWTTVTRMSPNPVGAHAGRGDRARAGSRRGAAVRRVSAWRAGTSGRDDDHADGDRVPVGGASVAGSRGERRRRMY